MKTQINEIVLIRPIIILTLVLMHSFTMYAGLWPLPDGIHAVRPYFWVQKMSFGCLLETFTMISGFLFALQLDTKPLKLCDIIWSKVKRLLLPCWLFGIIYMLLCYRELLNTPVICIYRIFSGLGHLWYLIMLFWCFIISYGIEKLPINRWYARISAILLAILSIKALPFQFSATMYYLPFFILGMDLWRDRDRVNKLAKPMTFWIGMILYIIALIIGTLIIEKLQADGLIYFDNDIFIAIIQKVIKLIYALLGCLVIWIGTKLYCSKHKLHNIVLQSGALCFGVYIYHQIILDLVYYHTTIPTIVGSYWLPIIGFCISALVSLVLTYLTRLTKFGRILIG